MKWILALVCSGVLFAQSAPSSIHIATPPPPGVANTSVTITHPGGPGTYYYWVVATYPIGKVAPLLPAIAVAAPTPSTINTIVVNWGLMVGATSYDVLRTDSAQFPGSCTGCLVSSANTSGSVTDNGTLTNYTFASPTGTATLDLVLNNRDFTVPTIQIAINGALQLANTGMGNVGDVQVKASNGGVTNGPMNCVGGINCSFGGNVSIPSGTLSVGNTVAVGTTGISTKLFRSVTLDGALCNGSHDDTTSIQVTLNSGAGIVLLPYGTCKITGRLVIPSSVTLAGQGPDLSVLANYGNSDAIYTLAVNVTINNLKITDNAVGRTLGHGIHCDGPSASGGYSSGCNISDVRILGHVDGVRMDTYFLSTILRVRVDSPSNDGFSVYCGSPGCTTISFISAYAQGTGRHGFYFDGHLITGSIVNSVSDSSAGSAFYFNNASGTVSDIAMFSPSSEASSVNGVTAISTSGLSIISPRISGCGGDGFHLVGARNVNIIGGETYSCQGYGVNAIANGATNTTNVTISELYFLSNVLGAVNDPNAAVLIRNGAAFSNAAGTNLLTLAAGGNTSAVKLTVATGGNVPTVTRTAADPSGACTPGNFDQNYNTGDLFYCQFTNVWKKFTVTP